MFIRKASVVLLGAALLVGCRQNVSTSERANPVGTPTYVQDKRVITDVDYNAYKILSVQEGTAGDLLKIQVNLQNTRNRTQSFNYMFEWFDMQGMQVSTPTSTWSSVTLEGQQQKSIQGIAPNSRAKDFRLHLQETKK